MLKLKERLIYLALLGFIIGFPALALTGTKLSQIASGGAFVPATDTLIAVRNGNTDVRIDAPNFALTNAANTFTVAPQTITIDDDSHVGLILNGHSATQSADLFQTYFNSVLGAHINAHAEFTNPGVVSTNERYGNNAARNISTGSTGLYIATNSGNTIQTGVNNTFSGYNTDGLASNTSQATIYGSGGKSASNTINIGVQNRIAAQNAIIICPSLFAGASGLDSTSTNFIGISANGSGTFVTTAPNSIVIDTGSSGLTDIEAAQNIAIGDGAQSHSVRDIWFGWGHNAALGAYTDLVMMGVNAQPNRNGEVRHTGGVIAQSERLSLASLTSTSAEAQLALLDAYFIISTNASWTSGLKLSALDFNGTAREGLRIESSGTVPQIGFFATASVAQQTGNLVTAMANYGLVTSATFPAASLTGSNTVAQGGTGLATLTAHAVMLGEGTSNVAFATIGTGGRLLIDQGAGADPAFTAMGGDARIVAGGTLTIQTNAITTGKINAAAVTYAKIQTVAGVSVFGNSSNIGGTGADITGTSNQVLIVNSTGTGLGFGQVNLASSSAITGVLPVANGGTNSATALAVPIVVGNNRQTALTAAQALTTLTVGGTDTSYTVSANVLVTTATLHNFTVTVSYTSEDNVARVLTLQFSNLAGTLTTAIANAAGAVPYEGVPLHIRCKAGTTVIIASAGGGTYTTVVYNLEERIIQE